MFWPKWNQIETFVKAQCQSMRLVCRDAAGKMVGDEMKSHVTQVQHLTEDEVRAICREEIEAAKPQRRTRKKAEAPDRQGL